MKEAGLVVGEDYVRASEGPEMARSLLLLLCTCRRDRGMDEQTFPLAAHC